MARRQYYLVSNLRGMDGSKQPKSRQLVEDTEETTFIFLPRVRVPLYIPLRALPHPNALHP